MIDYVYARKKLEQLKDRLTNKMTRWDGDNNDHSPIEDFGWFLQRDEVLSELQTVLSMVMDDEKKAHQQAFGQFKSLEQNKYEKETQGDWDSEKFFAVNEKKRLEQEKFSVMKELMERKIAESTGIPSDAMKAKELVKTIPPRPAVKVDGVKIIDVGD